LDALIDETVPDSIRTVGSLDVGAGLSETEALAHLRSIAAKNRRATSLIGMGYYDTIVPPVIQRSVLESPAWYTAYTPYQPEISQGRLEAMLNFQTMVCDLTGLDVANASLLDEATAAAEAMALAQRAAQSASRVFLVDHEVHPQTLAVLRTRAEPLNWQILEIVFRRAAAVSGDLWHGARSDRTDRCRPWEWRSRRRRGRPIGLDALEAAG
jgi:glycine dehydrogenase